MHYRSTLFTAAILLFSSITVAQPGALNIGFNATDQGYGHGSGTSGSIPRVTLIQPDGDILVGGGFVTYNGIERNRVVRLNADGTLDNAFAPLGTALSLTSPASAVYSMDLQTDGKLAIGGQFEMYNGAPLNSIARLDTDGSLDLGFATGTGANGEIRSIVVLEDDRILVAGNFTTFNGTTRNRIARLNADGSLDNTFDPGAGAESTIHKIIVQADGKIVIGGTFTTFNGTGRNRMARLNADGSLDAGFTSPIPTWFDAMVISNLAVQDDGKVLFATSELSGFLYDFTHGRTNADGTLDGTFVPLGLLAFSAMELQPDGRIILASNGPGVQVQRTNTDGTLDGSFTAGSGTGQVHCLALQADGDIIVSGAFTIYNSTLRQAIARLDAAGTLDPIFNAATGVNHEPTCMALQPDAKVIIGGAFSNYNNTPRKSVARLNTDGTLDTSFDPGTGPGGLNLGVDCTALQPDGKVLFGGRFTTFNGTTRNRIVRLNADGSLDTGFDPGGGAQFNSPAVKIIILQPDGKMLVGGSFAAFNDVSLFNLARLNADGSVDPDFNASNSGISLTTIQAITLQADGKFVVAYRNTSSAVVRLNADGSLDNSFVQGSVAGPTTTIVNCIVPQPDGKLLLGGMFEAYNAVSRNDLVRLNADGSVDESFDPGTGTDDVVRSIVLQPDGKFLVSGEFTMFDGNASGRLVRLNVNGGMDTGFNTGTGADGDILCMAMRPDGDLLIGGRFTSYDGIGRNRVAEVFGGIGTPIPELEDGHAPLEAWPNPTLDLLHLSTTASGVVVDVNGRTVRQFTSTKSIDLHDLPPGCYMVRTKQGQSRIVKE